MTFNEVIDLAIGDRHARCEAQIRYYLELGFDLPDLMLVTSETRPWFVRPKYAQEIDLLKPVFSKSPKTAYEATHE